MRRPRKLWRKQRRFLEDAEAAVEELEAPAAAEARRPSCELGLGVAWTEAPPKWLL